MADGGPGDLAPPPPIASEDTPPHPAPSALSNAPLIRLAKITSSTSGLDSLLLALQYPLLLLIAPPRHSPSPQLKALVGLISDARVFLRLTGLLKIYLWALTTAKKPHKDKLLAGITWAQIAASTVFQALENVAYLGKHGVLRVSRREMGIAGVWSARAWAAHVLLDLARLLRVKQQQHLLAEKGKGKAVMSEKEEDKWRHEVITDLAYAPLTLHYSLEGGVVGEHWIGLLGSVVGVLGWRRLWKETKV